MELRNRFVLATAVVSIVIVTSGGAAPADAQTPPPATGSQVQPLPTPPAQFQPGQPPIPFRQQGRRGAFVVSTPRTPSGPAIQLPAPKLKGEVSVEQTLSQRRTLRAGKAGQITLQDASQLLWAAQGVTGQWGRRAAPSAGGAYPIEVILIAGNVADLPAGVYRYYGASSQVERLAEGDKRPDLGQVARYDGIVQAPATFVITALEARAMEVFQSLPVAQSHVAMEAGAVTQNLMLQAVALGFGTAEVGDYEPGKLAQLLRLPPGEAPLAVVIVSRE